MNIKINEFKKIITSPIILSLLVLFMFFNSFVIFEKSFSSKELSVLTTIVNKYGYKINNKTMLNLKNDSHINLSKNDSTIEASYYSTSLGIDSIYKGINIMQLAETEIQQFNLKGQAADTVRSEYKSFISRFQQLLKNGENKNLFFNGQIYGMHSLLFGTLFTSFIFEIIILAVLITAYLINYEFDNNTQLLVYSTKRGRNIIVDKLLVAVFSTITTTTIIIGTGLVTYFSTFNYKGLWNIPISSYFNADHNLPYMSKWNMTFSQYLFCSVVLIYILALIFVGIAFFIATYVKNSYISFCVFAMVFATNLLLPSFMPKSSNAIFIFLLTPFALSMNSTWWFMLCDAFNTFKYYELIIVVIWTIIAASLDIFGIKKLKKVDIY